MSDKDKVPMTLAIRELQTHHIEFIPHQFPYLEKGGTKHSSATLGVPEHQIIKTLIMENDLKEPMVILMHGDLQVSTKQMARHLGVKTVSPCKPEVADRHSGYQIGGTSPFGTKRKMPIYLEKTILDFEKIFINGGQRGFLVEILASDLVKVFQPELVNVGVSSNK